MREKIVDDLSAHIDSSLVLELVESYEQLLARHRSGELEEALTKAGRFVENTLRAIEFIRTGTVLTEIKSVSQTIQSLENKTALHESLRLLIPRAMYGMIYNLRNKRDAIHVKEIDPTPIDVSLTVAAASWVLAEMLRLYHVSDEKAVAQAMMALSRTAIPFVEAIDGEIFVGQNVSATIEMLLLLAHARPGGMTRKELGRAAKCSPSSVTNALKSLLNDRYVHLLESGQHCISSAGEQHLAERVAAAS